MKLLLLSNSSIKGEPYLGWPQQYLQDFTADVKKMAFVPFAGVTLSYDDYTSAVQKAIGINIDVIGVHSVEDKSELLQSADCIAVGGGNTFYLLAKMQEFGMLQVIRERVAAGIPYIGWSAGSNVACPSIMTTNDMPIIQPESFNALGLTDFQINAHYTEKVIEGHGGESRTQRLTEFLEVNQAVSVVGLPEGRLLELQDGQWYMKGRNSESAYLFRYGQDPLLLQPGLLDL